MPLKNNDGCMGILVLDNAEQPRPLRGEQRNLLRLYASQATAAFDRTLAYEQERRDTQAAEFLSRVSRRVISHHPQVEGDTDLHLNLDNLFDAILYELSQVVSVNNFIAVLWDQKSKWLHYRLHVKNGHKTGSYWCKPSESGLMSHLVQLDGSLFLPDGTEHYRRINGIDQIGERSALSWMGVQMRVGPQIVGALILEDDDHSYVYKHQDFLLFQAIGDQLASFVHTAWLNEQQMRLNRRLAVVQKAGEVMLMLAEQREEWLWHVTLTVATAHYGFSFDRAVLFLAEEGGARLHGTMGIGHFFWEAAEADWIRDEQCGMDFDRYLQALENNDLTPTPVEEFVKGWSIEIGTSSNPSICALAHVLQSGETLEVKADEALDKLPREFTRQFGCLDCAIIPVKAGERVLGLVILDNVWDKEPQQSESLAYIDILTNQAALFYENLQAGEAQSQISDFSHRILAKANRKPLQDTLTNIAEKARALTRAELVAIAPRRINMHENERCHEYERDIKYASRDFDRETFVGNLASILPECRFRPHELTQHIIRTKQPVIVQDIQQHPLTQDIRQLMDRPMLSAGKIRALIGVPIHQPMATDEICGVLYLNYLSPQRFTAKNVRIAKSFADLAATAMRQSREYQAREDELRILGDVLREALAPHTDERGLIETLIHKTNELLYPLSAHVGLMLKDWQRRSPDDEPVEIRREYYLAENKQIANPLEEHQITLGISGLALQTGEIQNAPDVTVEPWKELYRPSQINARSELDVPILSDKQIIGVINVESVQINTFSSEHEQMLSRLASVAALALENVRRQKNLRTVLNTARSVTAPSELDKTLDTIFREVRHTDPSLSVLTIWYTDPESGELKLGTYFGVQNEEAINIEQPRKNGMIRSVMEASWPIWASDVKRNDLFKRSQFVKNEQIQSTVAFPLRALGETMGAMFFSYRRRKTFSREEKTLYPIWAEFVAASINDARLLRRAERHRQRLNAAQKVTEAVGTTLSRNETLTSVLQTVSELYENKAVSPRIMLYEESSHSLRLIDAVCERHQVDNPFYDRLPTLPINSSSLPGFLAIRAIQEGGKPIGNIADVADSSYQPLRLDTKSALGVALMRREVFGYSPTGKPICSGI
ncbi:GAF domain-containing protein [Chloroflexi bacterium TSY]|nr:GAF domain-containing protein [Chloroflexi bacterium TSY]